MRSAAQQEEVQRRAQRVDVARALRRIAHVLLGRAVARGDRRHGRWRRPVGRDALLARAAEVDQHGHPALLGIARQQHVGRLDVAVQDPALMRLLDADQKRLKDPHHPILVGLPLRRPGVEVAAVEIGHDHEGRALGIEHVVHLDHVRAVDGAQRVGLALEGAQIGLEVAALALVGVDVAVIGAPGHARRGELLNRNGQRAALAPSHVGAAEPAMAELRDPLWPRH